MLEKDCKTLRYQKDAASCVCDTLNRLLSEDIYEHSYIAIGACDYSELDEFIHNNKGNILDDCIVLDYSVMVDLVFGAVYKKGDNTLHYMSDTARVLLDDYLCCWYDKH